jgi:glycerophosphoryl diester phosphodiesterase
MIKLEQLVAHRGYSGRFPENSLPAIQAAMDLGAHWLEWDVQLSADRVPVLIHDSVLKNEAGPDQDVREMSAESLGQVVIGHLPDQGPVFIPTLTQALERLADFPQVSVFVEIKTESIDLFGPSAVLDIVLPMLTRLGRRAVLISFDSNILKMARDAGHRAVGWVIKNPDAEARQTARRLEPDFLFLNQRKLWAVSRPLWRGDWRWVAYTADSVEQANKLIKRGFELVETNDIGGLIKAIADGEG